MSLLLMILDGWGYRDKKSHNAIAQAHSPQWDNWWETRPHCLLKASGLDVGLPAGQMGNSEVGHMHMGAGRIIMQDFTRINAAIASGEFLANPLLNQTINDLEKTGKTLHIMGLFSDGGVHSHENHLFALLALCKAKNFSRVCLHLFPDGRDTSPRSIMHSLQRLNSLYPEVEIASVSGRYYAMDRDKRWERVEPVYRILTEAEADHVFPKAETAIEYFYAKGISDEFIPPTRIGEGRALTDGDALLFFNYRSDRARQLAEAFLDPDFSGFQRKKCPQLAAFVSMTEYAKNLPTKIAFPSVPMNDTLGEVVAKAGLKQLRIAETEKYAHVTFFFNGGIEQKFPHEDRILIPSPKVATYDLQPEMSAPALTEALIEAIKGKQYDLIICNYANADMVGHTGDFDAAVRAIECLDRCMQKTAEALAETGGQLLITADHGNAELMFDDHTQQPHTAHTCQPVPLVFIGNGWHFRQKEGSLRDIAPTLLALLGIDQPSAMTGEPLLEKDHVKA